MMRLGLVGVGAWGRRYIDTIARRQDCQIIAYARASTRVDDAIPGAALCGSWRQLVELGATGELDGVIVATTPETQIEIASAAATAGLPALVEKPLGTSAAAIVELQLALGALDVPPPIVVDYVHLFAPAYQELKTRVRAASVESNSITSIESVGCNNGPHRGWSSLYDYGVHDITFALDLLGDAACVELREAQRSPAEAGMPGELFDVRLQLDHVPVTLRFGNGSRLKSRRLSVALADGRALVYDDTEPVECKLTDNHQPVPLDATLPLDGALSHFIECCQQWQLGNPSPEHASNRLEFSLRVANVLDVVQARTSN